MKRIIVLFLLTIFGLVACGSSLPSEAKDAIAEKLGGAFSDPNYNFEVISVEKAEPANPRVDQSLCVVIKVTETGSIKNYITSRINLSWSADTWNETTFLERGCSNWGG
ncbi:hypothetical protein [Candidatus Leptofilum sp.]|uniref:hypothetical protein n=1 Tax=Candidatus Leptofilum sp. TaxID=3241576 RepID=UPI003B5A5BE6